MGSRRLCGEFSLMLHKTQSQKLSFNFVKNVLMTQRRLENRVARPPRTVQASYSGQEPPHGKHFSITWHRGRNVLQIHSTYLL